MSPSRMSRPTAPSASPGRCAGLGRKSAAIVANVLEDAGAEHAVGEAERALGGLDVLVAIVGQALFTPIVDMSP